VQLIHFPDAPRPKWHQPVVALGNFDGLHRGHLKLLEEVRREAGERGGTPVVLTFDPHPSRVLRPDKAPPLLMTFAQRVEGFERAGMHGVAVVRFTTEISRWDPGLFVEAVLVDWLRVSEVWVGANFLFGRDRLGTFTRLRALGDAAGFRVDKIDPVRYKDFVVSSTRVRHLVAEGRVDEAGALLGHQYFIDGTVVHGDGRGRGLGYPTANLETQNDLLPARGIYATMAIVDGIQHAAVTSVGVRPTFGGGQLTVETFLLQGEHELYGKPLRVAFVQFLRHEERFDDVAALRTAMAADCSRAAGLLRQIGL